MKARCYCCWAKAEVSRKSIEVKKGFWLNLPILPRRGVLRVIRGTYSTASCKRCGRGIFVPDGGRLAPVVGWYGAYNALSVERGDAWFKALRTWPEKHLVEPHKVRCWLHQWKYTRRWIRYQTDEERWRELGWDTPSRRSIFYKKWKVGSFKFTSIYSRPAFVPLKEAA